MRYAPLTTLRHQLAATILAGFLLVLGTGLVHLYAVRVAHAAMSTVAHSYTRLSIYTRLSSAAAELETDAFQSSAKGPGDVAAQDTATAHFQAILGQVDRARFEGPYEVARTRIVIEGERVPRCLQSLNLLAPRLEALEHRGGVAAVRAEIARLKVPYDQFRRDLTTEMTIADAEVEAQAHGMQHLDGSLNARIIPLLSAAMLLIAIVILSLLTRLKRGLDALEEGTRAVGAGALYHRIKLGGRDELARLAASFDAMAEDLSAKRTALQAANADLEAAVASRTRELSAANAALATEDRNRRRFMADVGHELRTPLTIIRGEAQLALRGVDRGGLEPIPIFDRILDQTHALERLVSDLFLIARAESHVLKLQRRPLDLGDLARKVAADFEALAVDGMAVITAKAVRPALADVDPDRVNQMLSALIDNALRHTDPGVSIDLIADVEDSSPTLRVCDDGPGVPPEDAEVLFSRFHRGETTSQGSGLGLAVVRALAEAHGGSATIEPAARGGFCMKLTFPPARSLAAFEHAAA